MASIAQAIRRRYITVSQCPGVGLDPGFPVLEKYCIEHSVDVVFNTPVPTRDDQPVASGESIGRKAGDVVLVFSADDFAVNDALDVDSDEGLHAFPDEGGFRRAAFEDAADLHFTL